MGAMAPSDQAGFAAKALVVEDIEFPAVIQSAVSSKNLVLVGAGVRGIQINPQVFLKVTCLGFYVEPELLDHVADKWKGQILADNQEFFADVMEAPYEKLGKIVMLKPLTGPEYSTKVLDLSKAFLGGFGAGEEEAAQTFRDICKENTFVPGGGMLYLFSEDAVSVAITQPGSAQEAYSPLFGKGAFARAILGTILGKESISPATKSSMAQIIASAISAK